MEGRKIKLLFLAIPACFLPLTSFAQDPEAAFEIQYEDYLEGFSTEVYDDISESLELEEERRSEMDDSDEGEEEGDSENIPTKYSPPATSSGSYDLFEETLDFSVEDVDATP